MFSGRQSTTSSWPGLASYIACGTRKVSETRNPSGAASPPSNPAPQHSLPSQRAFPAAQVVVTPLILFLQQPSTGSWSVTPRKSDEIVSNLRNRQKTSYSSCSHLEWEGEETKPSACQRCGRSTILLLERCSARLRRGRISRTWISMT